MYGWQLQGEVAPVDLAPSGAKCRHVINSNLPELFMGMCQSCFSDYVKSSGGIVKGAEDPPAFKRNLVKCVLLQFFAWDDSDLFRSNVSM